MRLGFLLLGLAVALLGATEAVGQNVWPPLPASSEDLWRRWVELVARPDDEITQTRFEDLFGVPLSR